MQRKLLLLSFIEGAGVMAAELCGAKLLAPIFGSSLYVWASVMGITLAALAFGYFFGGRLTTDSFDRNKQKLFRVLIFASLFLVLMPVIAFYLVPRISYLPFIPGVIISTISLLFFPVFFLGATSPLFVGLQVNETVSAGKASGTVYAVSTFGGIVATFLCGFYCIPVMGLDQTMILFGSLLFATTLLIIKVFKITPLLLFIAAFYLNVQFVFKASGAIVSSDGILGHFEVKDVLSVDKDSVRILKINNIIQTEMNMKTKHSVSEYIRLLDTLIKPASPGAEALVLGLGGGLVANLLTEKGYSVTGVELDERIVESAKQHFFLNKKVNTICQDARYYMNSCDEHFDVIVVDIFKAEEQPSHVLTVESLRNLKENLNASGALYVNWHGYTNETLGKGTKVLFNTLELSQYFVRMASLSNDQDHRNIIFVAEKAEYYLSDKDFTISPNVARGKYREPIPCQIEDILPDISVINTDNNPVLEKYNALANKTWRANYLRYYQNN